jgi:benzodiazapine receptor
MNATRTTEPPDAGLRPGRRPSAPRQVLALALLIVIPLSVGFLGSMATSDQVDGWYASADTAPWNPPNEVFGPVWSTLYVVMGFAAWLIWRRVDASSRRTALTVFVMQLVLNSIWSPLFFGGYPIWGTAALWAAVVVILLLVGTLTETMRRFWRISALAGALLIPYLAWVVYATTLNVYIAFAN